MSYKRILSNLVREVILESPPPQVTNPADAFKGKQSIDLSTLVLFHDFFKQWQNELKKVIAEYNRTMAILSGTATENTPQSALQEAVDEKIEKALVSLSGDGGFIDLMHEYLEFAQTIGSYAKMGLKKFQQKKAKGNKRSWFQRTPQPPPQNDIVRIDDLFEWKVADKKAFNAIWKQIPTEDQEQAITSLVSTTKPLPASLFYIITAAIGKDNKYIDNSLYKSFLNNPVGVEGTLDATRSQLSKYVKSIKRKTKILSSIETHIEKLFAKYKQKYPTMQPDNLKILLKGAIIAKLIDVESEIEKINEQDDESNLTYEMEAIRKFMSTKEFEKFAKAKADNLKVFTQIYNDLTGKKLEGGWKEPEKLVEIGSVEDIEKLVGEGKPLSKKQLEEISRFISENKEKLKLTHEDKVYDNIADAKISSEEDDGTGSLVLDLNRNAPKPIFHFLHLIMADNKNITYISQEPKKAPELKGKLELKREISANKYEGTDIELSEKQSEADAEEKLLFNMFQDLGKFELEEAFEDGDYNSLKANQKFMAKFKEYIKSKSGPRNRGWQRRLQSILTRGDNKKKILAYIQTNIIDKNSKFHSIETLAYEQFKKLKEGMEDGNIYEAILTSPANDKDSYVLLNDIGWWDADEAADKTAYVQLGFEKHPDWKEEEHEGFTKYSIEKFYNLVKDKNITVWKAGDDAEKWRKEQKESTPEYKEEKEKRVKALQDTIANRNYVIYQIDNDTVLANINNSNTNEDKVSINATNITNDEARVYKYSTDEFLKLGTSAGHNGKAIAYKTDRNLKWPTGYKARKEKEKAEAEKTKKEEPKSSPLKQAAQDIYDKMLEMNPNAVVRGEKDGDPDIRLTREIVEKGLEEWADIRGNVDDAIATYIETVFGAKPKSPEQVNEKLKTADMKGWFKRITSKYDLSDAQKKSLPTIGDKIIKQVLQGNVTINYKGAKGKTKSFKIKKSTKPSSLLLSLNQDNTFKNHKNAQFKTKKGNQGNVIQFPRAEPQSKKQATAAESLEKKLNPLVRTVMRVLNGKEKLRN